MSTDLTATLKTVKNALRIASSLLYDDELTMYINDVISDYVALGLTPEGNTFEVACVMYAKSKFGIGDTDNKTIWAEMYHAQLIKEVIRSTE